MQVDRDESSVSHLNENPLPPAEIYSQPISHLRGENTIGSTAVNISLHRIPCAQVMDGQRNNGHLKVSESLVSVCYNRQASSSSRGIDKTRGTSSG